MSVNLNSIYYCAHGAPVLGGQYVNFEHVYELRNLGLRVYILYIPVGEVERFESQIPIILYHKGMRFFDNDIVVIPEASIDLIRSFSSLTCRKMVHCQNPFYIFYSFP